MSTCSTDLACSSTWCVRICSYPYCSRFQHLSCCFAPSPETPDLPGLRLSPSSHPTDTFKLYRISEEGLSLHPRLWLPSQPQIKPSCFPFWVAAWGSSFSSLDRPCPSHLRRGHPRCSFCLPHLCLYLPHCILQSPIKCHLLQEGSPNLTWDRIKPCHPSQAPALLLDNTCLWE